MTREPQDPVEDATIEERVAALETWRSGIVAPALKQARDRLDLLEGFRERVRGAWEALSQGRRAEIEGVGCLEAYRPLTGEEREALAWLVEQRRRSSR